MFSRLLYLFGFYFQDWIGAFLLLRMLIIAGRGGGGGGREGTEGGGVSLSHLLFYS